MRCNVLLWRCPASFQCHDAAESVSWLYVELLSRINENAWIKEGETEKPCLTQPIRMIMHVHIAGQSKEITTPIICVCVYVCLSTLYQLGIAKSFGLNLFQYVCRFVCARGEKHQKHCFMHSSDEEKKKTTKMTRKIKIDSKHSQCFPNWLNGGTQFE